MPVLALLVNAVCDADDLICDLLLVALLSLLTQLLLASEVEAQGESGLVDLLHDLSIEVLACTLLGGEVQGDAALDRLDLLGLALVHHLTGKALGSELLHETVDLLVEWAELLLLSDLSAEELVVEDLELELGSIATSLLLVIHLILKGRELVRQLADAQLVR